MRPSVFLPAVLSFLLFASLPVWANEVVSIADFSGEADGSGVPKGWELKEKSGKADVSLIRDEAVAAVHMRSVNSSFSLQKKLEINLKQYPVLTWKWKVTKLPTGGDFRKSSSDDQSAQLFVAFTKTKSIVYIWDTTAPQGLMEDTTPIPFMHVKVVVVRSGAAELGKWVTESRNVYDDYKKLFGDEPPAVSGMRLQINSQHTGTSAESYFGDVAFKKQ